MENHTVQSLLKELHHTLEGAQDLTSEDREMLQRIVDDIHRLLGRSSQSSAQGYRSTIGQLEDATRRFEVSHPELTSIVARIINSLSNIGI